MYAALIIVAVALLEQTDASVRCFECVDMPHPQDCATVTTCTQHEICFVEQFVTSGGQILYSSGCLSKDRCLTAGKRAASSEFINLFGPQQINDENAKGMAKRQDPVSNTDIPTCIQCCDGNFCNVEGCGTLAVPREKRGPKCFSCDAQADPESCRDTQLCDMDKVCAIYKPLDRLIFDEWKTECMAERQCKSIVQVESQQLANSLPAIGKRDLVTVNKCPRCCTDDLCNHSCRQNLTVVHTTSLPTKPSTYPTIKPTHPTTKPTVRHTHHTTIPTVKHTHPTTKPTVRHAHHTTIPTVKHTHPTTKPTVRHAHHTTIPTVKHTHPTTKPTVKHAHHTTIPTTKHTHPTTKPTVKHTHPTTKMMITQTTHVVPTTDPAIGCKLDGYIYDPPTKLCLKFYESPKLNWTDAQNYCNSSKGQLAIITGDQKIKDVLAFYKDGGHTSPLWVGATDFGNGHVFTFTDGSKLTVDPSEGKDLKNFNCLYVTGGSYKGFGPCPDRHGFICERSSTVRE
ncbi:uncharacterized protein LOC123542847 [Mercenaria mercenaria]|uniref:uncharacterized protein LOC123542847 n=1 Tax=Mercenaria mercenaria TaxID=6596 RepID=UPI00234EFF9C|nr:uncharacterized protein LOC123542847 [Mercenaria mercenaria]XP_053386958.1 uncharacterized protein LOC123542847 [Mercenaria mercenaria]